MTSRHYRVLRPFQTDRPLMIGDTVTDEECRWAKKLVAQRYLEVVPVITDESVRVSKNKPSKQAASRP